MFLSMDILAGDLATWNPTTRIRDNETSRAVRYVIPAGQMPLDDSAALYGITATQLADAAERATPGANLLCVGEPDDDALASCDALNLLVLKTDEGDFDKALHDCAQAIAWYADGLTRLTHAVETGDEAALRRATALLRYCLDGQLQQAPDPNALAEQLNLLLHRNITSWQLLEDAIADWGWDLLDEYLCVSATAEDASFINVLSARQPGMEQKPPTYVYLPQDEYLVAVANLTHLGMGHEDAARLIADEVRSVAIDASIGASNPFSELQDLYYYGQQAKNALLLSAMLGLGQDLSFFHERFLDFVAARCLEACPPTTLFPPGYSRLRNHELARGRGGSLLSFLDIYVKNDFQMKPTVAEAFCSRTTAFDKLRRIKEISGMDLDDPNTRAALRIATHAIRLAKASPGMPE